MKKLVFLFSLLAFVACKNQNSESEEMDASAEMEATEEMANEWVEETTESSQEMYAPATNDDQMAGNIKNFLMLDYLKSDMESLAENDRKFQFYKIDINNDEKDEYFVRFMSPYFCGSGGCTMLLLDHEANIITKFTVMEPPVFVEKNPDGDWSNILVFSDGELKELKYSNGTYPSNPSVVPKAPYDAPSGHATYMFHDDMMASKTYTF